MTHAATPFRTTRGHVGIGARVRPEYALGEVMILGRHDNRVSSNAENLLKAVAAEIGLRPAIEILSRERARVAAVIG
jgi:hypothetical protein